MAAMVTLLLGTAPVVGQSDPPDGGSDVGSDEPAEPDPSEGDDGGGSLLCSEFDISEGWDESDVPGLHACLFDSVKGEGSGEPSVRQGQDGDEAVRSSACGDVDVEFVEEFVDSDPFGFSRRVRIVYFVHLTCEDGTPAVGISTRARMVVGPGAGSGADDCSVVRGSRYLWVSPPAAGGCVSYDFFGNALAAHRFDLTRSQSSAFRQVLVWADVDANGAYDPGEGFVLAPASPEPPLPSAPVGVSLASFADGSGVRVGWGRPTNHATAAPIGTYEVQWRASGEAAYPPANTVSSTVPPADVAGLTAGESYVLRVRAVDGAGRAGAWSTETTETARVLAAPGVVSTRSLSGMLRVSWEPPANQVGFVPVADYVVRWRPTSATNFDANDVRRGFSGLTVRGLTLGQTYALQARAVDIDGRGGAWSPEITATPQGPSGNGLRLPVSSVLVSNVAQPGASALGWGSGSVRYAQRFTTGTADSGYWLEAAGIRFDPQARTIDDFDITAELLLETASGEPGAVIATLATPEVIVPGAVNWFYAPAGTQLEPSNLYYLAVATTDPGDDHQLIQTLSTGEDDSSAAGWSISNSAHSFDASRGAWNQIPGILQVDIRGTQPPRPPAKVSAVLVGGAAVEITYDADLDESSVPSVGAFSVSVDGASRTISGVTVAGRVVTLTLASPITSAQTITVSYTAPTAADAARIESTNGEAAEGFGDQPVTIPPDPPTITGAESATGGLTVRWDAVADISGYDLEWRHDAEATWQSTRIDQQQHTIGDLTDGALYWVRVRAVKTTGELAAQTLYTTAWSQSEPAVAGDWAPQNLQVTSGDRMLAVTWDAVAGADGYEVEYRVSPEGAEAQRRSTGGARSVAPPPVAVPDSALPGSALAVLGDEGRWAAHITGIDNGSTYEVQVRALRTVTTASGDVTLRSAPVSAEGTSALVFAVYEASGPRVVWSGGKVTWDLELKHSPSTRSLTVVGFANQPIAAFVTNGPSTGTLVRCVLDGSDDRDGGQGRYGDCVTDAEGKVRLEYDAASVQTDAEVGVDELAVFADYDGDGQVHMGEFSTESEVGSTKIARPINLVALGDSYSSGQNGTPRLDRSNGFTGYYVSASGSPAKRDFYSFVNRVEEIPVGLLVELESDQKRKLSGPVDAPCRRWSNAYSQRLSGLQTSQSLTYGDQLKYNDRSGFWACEGAISLNIEHVPSLNPAPNAVAYLLYQFPTIPESERTGLNLMEVRRPSIVATDRPSHSYEVEAGEQNREHRQIDSLRSHLVDLRESSEDVDVIVLTIGGNDIGFSAILAQCIEHTCFELDEPPVDAIDPQQYSLTYHELAYAEGYYFETIFAELDTRLDSVFSELADLRSDPDDADEVPSNASVFVLGYPHLVPSESDLVRNCGVSGWMLDINEREREFLRRGNLALNARIKSAAERAGLHFVPVVGAFAGHEPCTSEAWVNGLELEFVFGFPPVRALGQSFHPNQRGHVEYAEALLGYIDAAIDAAVDAAVAAGADLGDALGDALNAAGLPVNRSAAGESSARGARSERGAGGGAGSVGAASGDKNGGADSDGDGSGESTEGSTEGSSVVRDVLVARRLVPVTSSCGAGFLSPGEVVVLSASGFAAGTSVAVSMRSAAAPWTSVVESSLPAATADAGGGLEVRWTAPTPEGASVPWAYAFEASGAGTSGGTLVARSLVPVVVYPGVAPCAVGDAASTTVGQAVRVAVLGNDVAPAGGSLASVSVDGVEGASVSVDTTDGAVTVAPDPGFVGTIVARYRVADSWGIRVGAAITVTVEAGCTITGTAGVEHIAGTDGDDVICVPDRDDRDAFHTIDAKAGDDVIIGGAGVEWVDGGAGSDVLYGGGGADRLDGGSGVDTIYGGAGLDTIRDEDLVDSIVDDPDGYELLLTPPGRRAHVAPITGDDAAYANVGETLDVHVLENDHDPNQNLVATSLSITRDPALGEAHAVVGDGGGVWVRYLAGAVGGVDTFAYEICDTLDDCSTGEATVTVGTAGCTIIGTDGHDELSGTAGADVICGLAGDDVIHGLGGDDILVGGPGDDVLYGGDDTLIGGDGADVLFGGPGADRLFGGDGDDTLWGGPGGDALAGNRGDDTIHGGAGNDLAVGGGEDDTLFGGLGDDNLDGHAADDTLRGGPGRDILRGGDGDDVLFGGAGNDQLTGGAGADTLWGGADIDLLWGNTQNDTLHGGSGIDILRGGGGEDRLAGGAGNDQLHGNAGDDRLWGGTGVDSLDGGNGADYLDGGDDTDTCARGETTARCET